MRKKPLEGPVLFVDRCLGRDDVRIKLESAGAKVELHDDHFDQSVEDPKWIRSVSKRGWVILTKDKRIGRNTLERRTLMESKAAAFILTAVGVTGEQQADAFLKALPQIERLSSKYSRPLLATVSRAGAITVRVGQRRGGTKKT